MLLCWSVSAAGENFEVSVRSATVFLRKLTFLRHYWSKFPPPADYSRSIKKTMKKISVESQVLGDPQEWLSAAGDPQEFLPFLLVTRRKKILWHERDVTLSQIHSFRTYMKILNIWNQFLSLQENTLFCRSLIIIRCSTLARNLEQKKVQASFNLV